MLFFQITTQSHIYIHLPVWSTWFWLWYKVYIAFRLCSCLFIFPVSSEAYLYFELTGHNENLCQASVWPKCINRQSLVLSFETSPILKSPSTVWNPIFADPHYVKLNELWWNLAHQTRPPLCRWSLLFISWKRGSQPTVFFPQSGGFCFPEAKVDKHC